MQLNRLSLTHGSLQISVKNSSTEVRKNTTNRYIKQQRTPRSTYYVLLAFVCKQDLKTQYSAPVVC